LIGVIVTLFGTGGLAADLGTAALLASGACFGIGSAMIRNASYIAMLKSVTTSEYGAVSTLWNLSIDFGIGFGSLVLGVVVGNTGIPFMFWLLPIVTAFAIPLAFSVKKIY